MYYQDTILVEKKNVVGQILIHCCCEMIYNKKIVQTSRPTTLETLANFCPPMSENRLLFAAVLFFKYIFSFFDTCKHEKENLIYVLVLAVTCMK